MIETIVAACGGAAIAVIGQLIMWAVNRKAEKQNKANEIANGVMFLLQDKIKDLAKHHIQDGQIPVEDLEDLLRMHEVYHQLGGNGYLNTLINAVKNLKIIK